MSLGLRSEFSIRGDVKKKISIFTDIVQIGGGGGQPHFKKLKRNEFLTKVGEGGGHKTYCQKLKHSILYNLLLNLAQPVPN